MKRKLVVGDIHGCYKEFLDLLDNSGISNDDHIIAVGDLIDRGPSSHDVLNFFMSHSNAESILGNHERKHVRSYRGLTAPSTSQMITRYQIGEEKYPDIIRYLSELKLYFNFNEAIIVHGFFEPGILLEDQKESVIVGVLNGDHYLKDNYNKPWYDLYDNSKPIIVGHQNYLGTDRPLIINDKIFCIDTTCYDGKALTGIILPDFKLLSVKSDKNYWTVQRELNSNIKIFMRDKYVKFRSSSNDYSKFKIDKIKNILKDSEKQDNIPEEVIQELKKMKNIYVEFEFHIDKLYKILSKENDRILAELALDYSINELTENNIGRLYTKKIKMKNIIGYLHLLRKKQLTKEKLKNNFKTLYDLKNLLEKIENNRC